MPSTKPKPPIAAPGALAAQPAQVNGSGIVKAVVEFQVTFG
jgi:hypothetical protein